jgi:hypothetical protein
MRLKRRRWQRQAELASSACHCRILSGHFQAGDIEPFQIEAVKTFSGIAGIAKEGCHNIVQKNSRSRPGSRKTNNIMSYPPSEYGPDPESSESSADFADFNKAQGTWKNGQQYGRANPLPLILVALVVGILLGAVLSRRERKRKDAVQAAKEWLEAAYEQLAEKLPQLAEKLPQLAEKLPQPKKLTVPWCQAAFLEQAQQVGKKLKWW